MFEEIIHKKTAVKNDGSIGMYVPRRQSGDLVGP